MRCRKVIVVAVALFAQTVSQESRAQWRLSIAEGKETYDAKEWHAGRLLNHDSGHLNAQALDLTYEWPSKTRLALQASRSEGDLRYLGQNQVGLPFASVSQVNLRRMALVFAQSWPINEQFSVSGQLALSMNNWHRRVLSAGVIQGLTERMTSLSIEPGVGAEYRWSNAWGITALRGTYSATRPIQQRLFVAAGAPYDEFQVTAQSHWGRLLGLHVEQLISPNVGLTLNYQNEIFRPGSSASTGLYAGGALVGSAFYPGAKRQRSSWSAGLNIHW